VNEDGDRVLLMNNLITAKSLVYGGRTWARTKDPLMKIVAKYLIIGN
jgi:hypothetical protein